MLVLLLITDFSENCFQIFFFLFQPSTLTLPLQIRISNLGNTVFFNSENQTCLEKHPLPIPPCFLGSSIGLASLSSLRYLYAPPAAVPCEAGRPQACPPAISELSWGHTSKRNSPWALLKRIPAWGGGQQMNYGSQTLELRSRSGLISLALSLPLTRPQVAASLLLLSLPSPILLSV